MTTTTQTLEIKKAYKTELAPTPEQAEHLQRIVDAVRYVYNAGLEQRKLMWDQRRLSVHWMQQCKELTQALKEEELQWLRVAPRNALDAAFQNLQRGYDGAFDRLKKGKVGRDAGFPVYHSRFKGSSGFKFFTQASAGEWWVQIPKVGKVALKEKAYIPQGKGYAIASASVTKQAGRWFVSVTVTEEIEEAPKGDNVLAIHLGLRRFATITDGVRRTIVQHPRPLERNLVRLGRLQRVRTLKKRGSRAYRELSEKIANLHFHIAKQREAFAQKLTAQLIEGEINRKELGQKTEERAYLMSYDEDVKVWLGGKPRVIYVEDWDIQEMLRDKKYSRAISDSGWGDFSRILEYKCGWNNVVFVKREKYFPSSKTCSTCGFKHEDFPLSEEIFECPKCGHVQHRDDNAVLNVLDGIVEEEVMA